MDASTSAGTVPSPSLPYRREYLEHLQPAALSTVSSEARQCDICLEAIHDLHRPVVLHDDHVFGESCIREWLSEKDTCPLCRKAICRENPIWVEHEGIAVCVNYDEENLEFLRYLSRLSFSGSDHKRKDLANLCFRYMHGRAVMYFLGGLRVDATQYRDYPTGMWEYLRDAAIADRVHVVHAKDLIDRLHGIFDGFFVDDNDAGAPSIASHPWSFNLLQVMIDTIEAADGTEKSGYDLYHDFKVAYESDMLDQTAETQARVGSMPSGWRDYAEDMFHLAAQGYAVSWFSEV